LEVNDPQTDPRLTYEIVEETHWYIDFFGDLIDIDALARNGPSRIEIPKSFFQQTLEIESARRNL
jgi:hypothetical protein